MIPSDLGGLDALDAAKRAHLRHTYTTPSTPIVRPALGRLLVRVGDRLARSHHPARPAQDWT